MNRWGWSGQLRANAGRGFWKSAFCFQFQGCFACYHRKRRTDGNTENNSRRNTENYSTFEWTSASLLFVSLCGKTGKCHPDVKSDGSSNTEVEDEFRVTHGATYPCTPCLVLMHEIRALKTSSSWLAHEVNEFSVWNEKQHREYKMLIKQGKAHEARGNWMNVCHFWSFRISSE